MFKIFVFACVVVCASAGNLLLASPYAVAPLTYAAAGAPLAYNSYHHQVPLAYTTRYAAPLAYSKIDGPSAFSTYSSVHTPDSYQQQYQAQVKPYATYSHEYLY